MSAETFVDLHDLRTRFPVGSRVFIRYGVAGEGVQTIEGTVTGYHIGLVWIDFDDGGSNCWHPDTVHLCDPAEDTSDA